MGHSVGESVGGWVGGCVSRSVERSPGIPKVVGSIRVASKSANE